MIRTLLCATACLVSSLGCNGDVALARGAFQPELARLDMFGSVLLDRGLLAIHAALLDTSQRVRDGQYVTVRVTTARGELEDVNLEREICDGLHLCAGFSVGMRGNVSVQKLVRLFGRHPDSVLVGVETDVGPLPGRLTYVGYFDSYGGGYVWRASDLPRVMRGIRFDPDVDYVEQSGTGCFGICPPFHTYIAAFRPIDDRPPVKNNGWIEARTGDTITITYTQPSGAVLVRTVVMS